MKIIIKFTSATPSAAADFYVLGKPRMGKSWLLVNLITQDILNAHGVFFVDPHGDAIQEVINCMPADQSDRIVLLDPEDPQRSFGINPLYCRDIDSLNERNAAYTKAKGLFDKIWKIAFEQTPWLQSNLENAIYAFIENPGLTLLELPIFYRNA